MADFNSKVKENVSGKYFVDDQCIACNACIEEAADFFSMEEDQGHAFVKKQPIDPLDEKLCQEALKYCPVEAIGIRGVT